MPNKVKHFAWKACRNILDTKENLWRRNITNDGVCESCVNLLNLLVICFGFVTKRRRFGLAAN